jgi:hypothetical protein
MHSRSRALRVLERRGQSLSHRRRSALRFHRTHLPAPNPEEFVKRGNSGTCNRHVVGLSAAGIRGTAATIDRFLALPRLQHVRDRIHAVTKTRLAGNGGGSSRATRRRS